MTEKNHPHKNTPDAHFGGYDPTGDDRPAPLPVRKTLHPLFGTRCRTQTYGLVAYKRGHYHMHLEAVLDDPVKKTWAVRKIVSVAEPRASIIFGSDTQSKTYVHQLRSGISFTQALDMMQDFERSCRNRGQDFRVLVPDAPMMGFDHYRAFAEREGYVFDITGRAHARPAADALPAGGSFDQRDIDTADKLCQRPANEFDNNGPASKTPNTHFLFDQFTRATHGQNMHERLVHMRVLDILDHFAGHVQTAHDKLKEYCTHYQELGQGGLIYDAEQALKMAGADLRQLKAYGVDTTHFDNFLLQCEITCHVLHAEGLYDLMNNQKGDFAQNEMLFKERVNKALEGFRKIDSSERGLQTLQDMIVQTPKPEVPESMTAFLENYARQKEAFRDKNHPGARPDTPKKPPQL